MSVFLEPLALTLLFEVIGAYILGIRKLHRLFLVFLVNCITNPLLVMCSLGLMNIFEPSAGLIITYIVLEPIVIYCEYRMYLEKLETDMNPLVLSVILNLCSIIGGNLWRILL